MKFSDLIQFTRCRSGGESVRFYRINKVVEYHEKDYGLILNPDFQRGHVWTEEQQIAFVEYQLRGGKSGKELYFNDPRLRNDKNDYRDYVCVDGLQRLTAVTRFLRNEIPAFGHYYDDYEDKPSDVYFYWIINDLQTKKEVMQWYVEMNTGGVVHSNEEIERVKKMIRDE